MAPYLAFGPFELDPTSGELRREGRRVDLQPKLLAILLHLILHRDRWVRKEELLARVWPDVVVSDAAVASALHDLREALGDDGQAQDIVRTMRGRGYRFVAIVEERSAASDDSPSMTVAPPVRGTRRPAGSLFVGRREVLTALEQALDDALAGRGRLVLLAGEPGIGKTRTAHEASARARARGIAVHAGACSETSGAPVFWPWVRVLRSIVAMYEPTALRVVLDWRAPRIAQLLPELRTAWPDLPALPRDEGEASRFELFDAVTGLLHLAAAERGLLIHLDDLHRADEGSLALLRFLVSDLAQSRIVVVASHRDTEADRTPALDELLAKTASHDVCMRIRLTGLPPEEVRTLVTGLLDTEPDDGVLSVVQARADGNPFFVRELVALIGRADGAHSKSPARIVPHRVLDAVRERLARLTPECRDLLTMAAVVGREFDPAVVAQALDDDPTQVEAATEEAVQAGLLTEGDDGVRFSHVLVRDAIYEATRRSGRATAHRRFAETLEGLAAGDPDSHLAALAHHYAEAVPAGTRRKAIDYAQRAARRAMGSYAFLDAAQHLERACALLEGDASASPAERCDLLLALGHAYEPSGLQNRHRDAFRRAAAVARELRDGERLARAALGFALGILIGDVDAEASQLLEEALAAIGPTDSSLRVQILARLAHLVENEGRSERADALLAEATARASRVQDLEASLALIKNRGNLWMGRAALPEQQLANRLEGIRLAELAGDAIQASRHRAVQAHFLLALGDRHGAERELARAASGDRVDWMVDLQRRMYAVLTKLATGMLEGVEADIDSCRRFVASRAVVHGGPPSQLFFLRREEGRLAEMTDLVRAAPQRHDLVARSAQVLLLAEAGESARARAFLETALDFRSGARPDAAAALLAEACDVLQERHCVSRLLEVLGPHEPHLIVLGNIALTLGPAARYVGLLHLLAGDLDAAERCFADAQTRSRAVGWTLWESYAQLDEAKLRLARRGPGDLSRAHDLAAGVLGTARPAGLVRLARRAEALLSVPAGQRGLRAV